MVIGKWEKGRQEKGRRHTDLVPVAVADVG